MDGSVGKLLPLSSAKLLGVNLGLQMVSTTSISEGSLGVGQRSESG